MKKIIIMLFLLISIVIIPGCSSNPKPKEEMKNNVVKATRDEDGDIVINSSEITGDATFLSYEIDGITIGLIVVKGTDGKVRVAFNTCQSCAPEPDAYFVQKGVYFECQNCKNHFHVDDIGTAKGGCNPAPVEEMKEENGTIIISKDYVRTYKKKFENWNGPK